MSRELQDYEALNLANWNERAKPHASSPDYNFEQFLSDPSYLSDVIQYDRPHLGDITGLNVIHLQCHIGTDTLSLARLGAASVIGLDFSPDSLAEGRRLAQGTMDSGGEKVKFVEGSVYSALDLVPAASFDLVYTSIGVLCWLHSVKEWAKIVGGLLKPSGRFYIREASPVLWTIDDKPSDKLIMEYTYFERKTPTVFDDPGTYVQTDAVFSSTKTAEFNHGMGEIIQSILDAGLRITKMFEGTSVPWEAVPGQMTLIGNGEWQLTDRPWRIPHCYVLCATRE